MRRDRSKCAPLFGVLSILPFLGIEGCAASVDVQVLDLDTGTVVGQLRPSFFGMYRDMVVGVDATGGRLAVVEWGDRRSTLKIITLQPWRVSEQTIGAGRVTYGTGTPRIIEGIAGPMAYDFATRRFFYTTGSRLSGGYSLHFIAADGEKKRIALPTSGGGLLPCGESVFLHSIRSPEGAYSILKVSLADSSCSEVHRSNARLFKVADLGEEIGVLEERKGEDDAALHLILVEKLTSRKNERRLPVPGYRSSLEDGALAAISRDDCIVFWTPIESREAPKDIKVEAHGSVYEVTASRKHLFLQRGDGNGNRLEPLVIEAATGRTKGLKEMLAGANVMPFINHIRPLSSGGKNLIILSE
jgi:hypothetical protein